LPKLLAAKLGSTWTNAPLDHKQEVGRLWMPCLTKAEVQSLFETVDTLKSIRQEIEESVTYWKSVVKIASLDCMIDIEGELFFEAPEGYELIRVENG